MKNVSLAVVFLLCLIAVAIAQHTHCIEHSFQVQSFLYIPSKRYDDEHLIYFDVDNLRQRYDVHEYEPEEKFETVIMRYDLHKQYIIDKKTGNCTVHPLPGSMEPFCLADNSTHVGQLTLGGSLKCDIYQQEFFGFDTRFVISSVTGIPINIFSKGVTHHESPSSLQEWYNFSKGIKDPSVFNIPPQCKETNTRLPTGRSLEILKRVALLERPWARNN